MKSIVELKAQAYDLIALLEKARKDLDQINLEIAKRLQSPPSETLEEAP